MTDTAALMERAKKVWSSADYGPIAVRDVYVSELLARNADVHYGERVLDVGAGTGNTALAAARRGGRVTATDVVPASLDMATQRAAVEGLSLQVQVADAQALPFEDGSFDVVLSSFGAMYAADHQRTADELLRVCRPGGRIGLVSWTPNGVVARLQKVMAANMPAPPGPRGEPPVLWGSEDHCRQLFGARVKELSSTVRTNEWCAASAADQVEFLLQYLPPWRTAATMLPPETLEKVKAASVAEIERVNRAGDGTLVAQAEYLELVATVA